MAKDTTTSSTTSTSMETAPAQPAAPQQIQIPTVEAPDLAALYSNFVRVNPTPEELVLDFALNPNAQGGQITPIKISQRLVLNYFTAKRLWAGLGIALQRHEQTFGVLETDVNKRVVPVAQRPKS
jgi:Protein of unknown function (DUF3467)